MTTRLAVRLPLPVPLGRVVVLLALLASPVLGQQPASAPRAGADTQSLYKRLGGYDAVAAVTDDFVGRLVSEPKFTRFFGGHGNDSKKRIRQHIVDQLCAATGGPCIYTGRDMKTTHAGLGITEDDWNVSVVHLRATLDKFKVGETERTELLTALTSLKRDIVER